MRATAWLLSMLRPSTYNGDGVLVSDGTTTSAQDLAAPLSQVLSDGTATYVYGHDRLRALGGPWYVGDALGSVRQTLDDAGAVLATTSYDPWGTPQGALSAPFGFTGELHHPGQVYLRARWYAPGQGRFVSEDPFAGFPELPYSLHAYQYAYSNPVRWTDPTGTIVCAGVCIGLLVTGGVIILVAVTHEATRSTQMAVDTMPPLDPSMVIPMPDAATQARNRANVMRSVAYLRNPRAYVWVTPPMDPGPPDPVGYAGPSLQYPSREDLTVRSPRTGPEEVCVVWPGPSRQASLWPLTTGAPGEQVDAPLVWMAQSSYTNQDLYTHPSDIAHRRSTELQQAIPANTRGRITMSAGVVENPDGTRQVLIGSSEPGTYLRPGVPQALEPGETVVSGVGHAEEKIVKDAIANGQKVIAVGAGRPHCRSCVNWITNAGGGTASPRRQP